MSIKKERRKLQIADADFGAGVIESAAIADDAITNAKLGPTALKSLKFQYDFADLGGAAEAITLTDDADAAQTIPDNAVIVRAYIEGITSAASSGSATVKLGITGDDDCLIAATDFDNGEFDATTVTALTAGIPIRTTTAVSVLATVAVAALTAGKFNIWVEYYEGD